eukprot:TCONS_00007823-protein
MNKNKRLVSVYVLPPGSKPIVRVECPEQSIEAQRLFKLCCDTIQLYESSRRFFGLFRGLLHPVKKYGDSELIMLPVKTYPISIQKWSFDIIQECRLIKTDPIAIRLLALQYKCDLEMKRKHPTKEQLTDLKSFEDPEFTCYKQYLDCARRILDYTWTVVLGVEVVQKVKLVTNILQKGSKVDLACTPKKLIIIGQSFDLAIPWRKIRRFAEINETKTISVEILLESKNFTWIEFKTIQGVYLLQVLAEYIETMNVKLQPPVFKQPKFVLDEEEEPKKKITFTMLKEELFGAGKKKKEEDKTFYQDFDAIDVVTSSDENESESEEDEISMTSSSRRSSITSQFSAKKYLTADDGQKPGPSNTPDRVSKKTESLQSAKSVRNEGSLLAVQNDNTLKDTESTSAGGSFLYINDDTGSKNDSLLDIKESNMRMGSVISNASNSSFIFRS